RRPRRGLFRGRDRRDPRALGALSDPRVSVEVEPLSTEQTLAVETRDLACTYMSGATSVAALDGVTLTVRRGEFVAVMGPSGSGKSTLLNVIAGLERPTSGWVRVDGEDLAALNEAGLAGHRSKRVGMVFQAFNLLPRYRVVDNVALPLIFAGVPRAERTARARALLDRLGMSSRAEHRTNELSGGELQRAAIARALLGDLAAMSLGNYARSRLRSALTTAGVAIGTALVVLLIALATGAENNVRRSIFSIGDLRLVTVQPFQPGANGLSAVPRTIDDGVVSQFR